MGVVIVSCGDSAAPPTHVPPAVTPSPALVAPTPPATGETKTVHIEIPGAAGPSTPTPAHAWPPGTPDPVACRADADCVVVPVAPQLDPCCDVTVTALPRSRAYLQFVEAFRARECGGVACPVLQMPGARLAPCGYEGRCVRRRCDNACNAAAAGVSDIF